VSTNGRARFQVRSTTCTAPRLDHFYREMHSRPEFFTSTTRITPLRRTRTGLCWELPPGCLLTARTRRTISAQRAELQVQCISAGGHDYLPRLPLLRLQGCLPGTSEKAEGGGSSEASAPAVLGHGSRPGQASGVRATGRERECK
jgi:hypothetical protein